ncbi:MAG: hydrogenase maturation protease [Terriglobales bacterium]
MPTTLILGYGNLLRSDDGVGSKAAAALERELSTPELQVIAAHQITPEMAEPLARSARALFLDASHTGAPGEIRCQRICREDVHRDPNSQPANVSHHLSPSALLELAARYFHAEPEAWLLTITGDNFDLGESLSPAVEAVWEAYLDRIRTWVCGL